MWVAKELAQWLKWFSYKSVRHLNLGPYYPFESLARASVTPVVILEE